MKAPDMEFHVSSWWGGAPRRWLTVCFLATGLALTGCAHPSTAQIREMVKDKNASITCVKGTYAGANITTVVVNADKGIAANIDLGDDCKLKMQATDPKHIGGGR